MIFICLDKREKVPGEMPPRCGCGAYLSTTLADRYHGKFFCKSRLCKYRKKRTRAKEEQLKREGKG